MFKRVLATQGIQSDNEDSDDGKITAKQRRRLQNKFIPGAARGLLNAVEQDDDEDASTSEAPSESEEDAQTGCPGIDSEAEENSSDPEDSAEEHGREVGEQQVSFAKMFNAESEDLDEEVDEEEEDSDMDDTPAWPAACEVEKGKEKKLMQFRCELCPDKRIKTQKELDAHLQSRDHLKVAAELERASKIGLKAYQKECVEKAKKREKEQAKKVGVVKKAGRKSGGADGADRENLSEAKKKREAKKQKYLLKKREQREKAKKKTASAGGAAGAGEKGGSKKGNKGSGKGEKAAHTKKAQGSEMKETPAGDKQKRDLAAKEKTTTKAADSQKAATAVKKGKAEKKQQRIEREKAAFAAKKARRLARKNGEKKKGAEVETED
eukprot:g2245.t1